MNTHARLRALSTGPGGAARASAGGGDGRTLAPVDVFMKGKDK
jgi:hypothetical protein